MLIDDWKERTKLIWAFWQITVNSFNQNDLIWISNFPKTQQ